MQVELFLLNETDLIKGQLETQIVLQRANVLIGSKTLVMKAKAALPVNKRRDMHFANALLNAC